ncbi:MAG: hypothetical protein ACK4WC_07320 [Rubrimonas sp.]
MPSAIRTAVLGLSLSAAFQAGALASADQDIPIAEWREMTEGRIVWYSIDGRHWGREYFHPGGRTATFVAADGTCMTTSWTYANGVYCFAYGGLDCFRHVRRDGVMLAIPTSNGTAQTIDRITEGVLSCGDPLSS